MSHSGLLLRISGKVQGVGFRPFVWQLAEQLNLRGEVWNDSAGVEIRLVQPVELELFLHVLHQQAPPLAQIDRIQQWPFTWLHAPNDFSIRPSQSGAMATHIVPDAATCPQCLQEMNDPQDRRYRYPFINCTHCGPRFTLIRTMPYDRPATSMAPFILCPRCDREYHAPQDRRFHAQPVACSECGPQLFCCGAQGEPQYQGEAALQQATVALAAGHIVAIKGLGGFHLACDATNTQAVDRLRLRKRRPSKPLAVMLPDTRWLERCSADVDLPRLQALLTSPAAPIVLTALSAESPLSEAIAPQLNEVGLMLPANPIQHLLMQEIQRPLVMTSGNAAGHAPVLTNDQALTELTGIADLWLMHNREIVQRADDSLVRLLPNGHEMLRRARGFVPDALPLPPGFPAQQPLLAVGGDRKNTFCLIAGDNALLSAHFGDLEREDIQQQWQQAMQHFIGLYHCQPQRLASDAHPGYVSHQWAARQSLPVTPVLHHHAHLAACLAEHHWPLDGGALIGLALDGLGYGQNGALWGGECLLFDYRRCRHLGGLPAVALPGGDRAAQQPWRNQLAHFARFVPDWQRYPQAKPLLQTPWQPLLHAINAGINAPLASSCGRLFDAAAAALGYAPAQQSWEGEAASIFEALAHQSEPCPHPVTLPLHGNQLDLSVFWQQWLGWQAPAAQQAWAFHDALAQGFANMAKHFAAQHGIKHVAVSGGVLHNRLLRQLLQHHLAPLQILLPQQLPAGDGGLALGQALVACAQHSPASSSTFDRT
ncbi:Carbamoyltransferase HypF [Serratia grimesii]|jgi:hydrogenase maturation protein HypF|uniref:carbamoyltransferase HypF n=1 Tax=Serratia grimesii TaxID=82995 RepID=UPI00076F3E78|nr:carbamoyltransferase HypF [Serratia grimesii]CUW18825.1 Carbamoyltransferase HypF [Serratia grimesii]SMZ56812.1 Carbamoyltransferase HypF [Serratia grimesii]